MAKKMSEKMDDAKDKKAGIKENTRKDSALDKKRGLKADSKKKKK